MWNDDDFKCCKMDEKFQPLLDALESINTFDDNEERVFNSWKESWETYTLKPTGDSILEAGMFSKYGGIQWIDPDNGYVKVIANPERMWFQKNQGNNHYDVLATMESYDFNKHPNEQGENFEAWELTDDFYECVT